MRRPTRPNHKHIPCASTPWKAAAARALPLAWAVWLLGAGVATAQPIGANDLPRPDEQPVFVQPSPIGDLEYRPGRGLRVGDTGLTVGGFGTILASRKEEGGATRFTLDDLNLFLLFDPTPFFHVFTELGFENLVELGDTETAPEPRDGLAVDRLYGDLNLTNRVNFRFGKFFAPVGIWNQIPAEPLLWTASRPLVTEGPFDEQVTGGMAFGSFYPANGTLTYKLFGQFLQPLDPDPRIRPAHRSAGARLEYSSLTAWTVGSSVFSSERGGHWNHVGGFDALWRAEKGEVMGEFLIGRGDPDGRHLGGFYLQGVRELIHTLSIVGRYEYFDPGSPLRSVNLFDVGFSWRPSPYIVFTLDYLVADRTAGIDRTEQNLPGLRFQLSVLF